MSVPIKLDVGDPPRTIYEDIVSLPDPVKLGITIRAYNYDDVGLYFQVTAQCSAWTFETVNLGLIGSGANIYQNLDEFGSRAKPASETEQIIKLILKAYTDAGYSNLKWTFEKNIDMVFIKSDDPSYTTDVLNNFDDGTVQGWAVANEQNNWTGPPTYPILSVVSDYVLSALYSIKMTQRFEIGIPGGGEGRGRLYKSFATPNKDIIYAIIDIRAGEDASFRQKYLLVQGDATTLIYLGRPFDTVDADYVPVNKWIRIVIPLPKNTTVEIRIVQDGLKVADGTVARQCYLWMDDFKIISK